MAGDTDYSTADASHASEEADSLYTQGMAHYRRREWQEAKSCFARLKAVAPDRRGVDALLNEVDIFIQLQAMQPGRQEAETYAVGEEPLPTDVLQAQETVVARGARRRPLGPAIAIVLALLMVVVLALYATGVLDEIIGSQRQARVGMLVNQGRAALNMGDCDRASSAFGEALALEPGNEEVQTLYAKARRCQQLMSLYTQATTAIAAEDWDGALEKLNGIMELDPTYKDASEQIDLVKEQQALAQQLDQATAQLEKRNYGEAIQILEGLRDQAPTFKAEVVTQTLFSAFFGNGVDLMATAGESLDVIGQAIQSFDRAIALFPSDETVLLERQLADLYRQGLLFFGQKNWPQAVDVLQQIYARRPDYIGGKPTSMLCTAHLRLGDAYYEARDLERALEQYQAVLSIGTCDHVEAAAKEREVYLILYPPTPTPTRTPAPTLTPRATPTFTAIPTIPTATARPGPPPAPTSTPVPRD